MKGLHNMDDTFTLYDLKVEVVASDRPMVCSHKVGDYFLVQGENLVFQKDTSFSLAAWIRPHCDWTLAISLL